MTRITYWLCFFLVFLAVLLPCVAWPIYLIIRKTPFIDFILLFSIFGSLIPPPLVWMVPGIVRIVLGLVMAFLLLRRIWLFFSKKERFPSSFHGFQKILGYIGAISFVISIIVLVFSILLKAGSGVPAGMLMIPATFCVPWSFFLTEVISFRHATKKGPPA